MDLALSRFWYRKFGIWAAALGLVRARAGNHQMSASQNTCPLKRGEVAPKGPRAKGSEVAVAWVKAVPEAF